MAEGIQGSVGQGEVWLEANVKSERFRVEEGGNEGEARASEPDLRSSASREKQGNPAEKRG